MDVNKLTVLHLANQVCDGNLLELSLRINNLFKSVSDHHNDYLQLEIPCVPSKYVIPVEKVEKQLRKLDTSKAPGPDCVPSWVLKEFSELLAGPVAAIYNSSLREGMFPVSGVLHTSAPFRKRNHQNISKQTLDQSP